VVIVRGHATQRKERMIYLKIKQDSTALQDIATHNPNLNRYYGSPNRSVWEIRKGICIKWFNQNIAATNWPDHRDYS